MAKVRKIGKRWVADFRDDQGRRHREFRPTKREAESLLASRLEQIARGRYNVAGRTKKFGPFALEWLESQKSDWEPNTLAIYESKVKKYLLNEDYGLGEMRVKAIDLPALECFKTKLDQNNPDLSNTTKNHVLRTLGMVLKHSIRHGIRSSNPTEFVPKFTEKRSKVIPLTPAEAKRLLQKAQEAGEGLHALVGLTLATGLRLGEVLALRWRDVGEKALLVEGTNSHASHRQRYKETGEFGDPKTERSNRKVLLSRSARRILKAHRMKMGNPDAGKLVFPNACGHPMDPKNFRDRQWKPLLKAARIPAGFSFHGLRHTYASHMLSMGVPVEFVQAQLGHSSYQTTLSRYRHWIPSRDDQHVEVIEDALLAAVGQ